MISLFPFHFSLFTRFAFPAAGKSYTLCSQLSRSQWWHGKNETLVRYSVLSENRQIFASQYPLILPSEEELQAELERRHILEWPEEGGGE